MLDNARLLAAYSTVRSQLLAHRSAAGHWVGELASSAVSTATAVSALSLVADQSTDISRNARLRALAVAGTRWLLDQQNVDGGWGDTDKSYSNIATTLLCRAALEISGVVSARARSLDQADQFITQHHGIAGVRARYGADRTFAVPILTNAALAGLVPWKEVSSLPFEFAWLPQSLYRFARLPVVSYAIPALVAIGQAKFFHQPPNFFLLHWLRSAAVKPTLEVLSRMQPASGGYLEATPLTSFVVMSLASIGFANHPVSRKGINFLIASARDDGSWPIDTNLATWNTTLALNALAGAGEDIGQLECLSWLLACQYRERHPFTGAEPGGWGWTNLSGAVPDADDTPGALLALAAWKDSRSARAEDISQIQIAAAQGLRWLLDLQNRDGGWPTFCRGWGKLPFDRSGCDLTAHALRAIRAWLPQIERDDFRVQGLSRQRVLRAVKRGFQFLDKTQTAHGYWTPLWFGNQDHPQELNPVYGTAKVLLAYRDWEHVDLPAAQRGYRWLIESQFSDTGAWGAGDLKALKKQPSIEETALAVESLLDAPQSEQFVQRGLTWLVTQIESGNLDPSPIGFYFAKLWYYEALYPYIFAVSALGAAIRKWGLSPGSATSVYGAETGTTL